MACDELPNDLVLLKYSFEMKDATVTKYEVSGGQHEWEPLHFSHAYLSVVWWNVIEWEPFPQLYSEVFWAQEQITQFLRDEC